jgi:ribonuclease HI
MGDTATINVDGASRGNPGPAAFAFVIARPDLPHFEKAATLGTATNNVAEYTALVRGLEAAADLGLKRLTVFSDSELVVRQMNGEYRVKHPDLRPLYLEARAMLKEFSSVTITHIRREDNKRADALCNEVLDAEQRKVEKNSAARNAPSELQSRGLRPRRKSDGDQ